MKKDEIDVMAAKAKNEAPKCDLEFQDVTANDSRKKSGFPKIWVPVLACSVSLVVSEMALGVYFVVKTGANHSLSTSDTTRHVTLNLGQNGFNETDFESPNNENSLWERTDGVFDPFAGRKPENVKSYADNGDAGKYEKQAKLFGDDYSYVPFTGWYVDMPGEGQERLPMFYNKMTGEYSALSAMPGEFIDAVYSNGTWSYIANANWTGNLKSKEYTLQITQAKIYNLLYFFEGSSYPYSVYFDDSNIYFMNVGSDFSDSYLATFQTNDIKLFYLAL